MEASTPKISRGIQPARLRTPHALTLIVGLQHNLRIWIHLEETWFATSGIFNLECIAVVSKGDDGICAGLYGLWISLESTWFTWCGVWNYECIAVELQEDDKNLRQDCSV